MAGNRDALELTQAKSKVCSPPTLGHKACGILVPRPGIEPGPSAVRAWSPNHWTAREFPKDSFIIRIYKV